MAKELADARAKISEQAVKLTQQSQQSHLAAARRQSTFVNNTKSNPKDKTNPAGIGSNNKSNKFGKSGSFGMPKSTSTAGKDNNAKSTDPVGAGESSLKLEVISLKESLKAAADRDKVQESQNKLLRRQVKDGQVKRFTNIVALAMRQRRLQNLEKKLGNMHVLYAEAEASNMLLREQVTNGNVAVGNINLPPPLRDVVEVEKSKGKYYI